jgi:hypothetical protein
MWAAAKDFVGNLWGHVTTQAAIIIAGVMAVPLPPDLSPPDWLRWGLFGLAVLASILRLTAPPPPAVVIKKDDAVAVDHMAGTITIAKAEDIPATMVSKAAGE